MIDPNLGQVVGERYEIIRLVGSGGYGAVYVGEPTDDVGAPVAVKLLKADVADQEQVLRRFEREARVMQMIDSPHTPRLHASGRLPQGGAFIAMDFIDGITLSQAIREGPLDPHRVVRIARGVLDVLSRLHALEPPVYHRDLKPGNLMLRTDDQGEETAFVLDFGIAKIDHGSAQDRTVQTAQGMLPGSISYSAPERFEEKDDPRSDLYSLGVIMFEALSGRNPFRLMTPLASMRAHAFSPPPDDLTRRAIEPALVAIVHRALEKNPAHRFADAQAMLDALMLLPISAPEAGDDTDLTPVPAAQLALMRWRTPAKTHAETPPDWLTSEPVPAVVPPTSNPTVLPGGVQSAALAHPTPPVWKIPALVATAVTLLIFMVWLAVRPGAAPIPIEEADSATPESKALPAAPASTAPATTDTYNFVTVVVRPGPARFVQVDSKTVLCESARRCKVPIDIDTRVEQDGFISQVLSGDDLFDRRGHSWRLSLRARR